MEFLRAGEALVRSSQPLLPFLAPSAFRPASRTATKLPRQCLRQHQPTRTFTASTHRCQPSDAENEISRMLDETLDQDKRMATAPRGRSTRYGSRHAQQQQRTDSVGARIDAERTSNRSSYSELINDIHGTTVESVFGSGNIDAPPAEPQPPPTPPVKLNSTVGRSIPVNDNRGMDVGRAFRTLEMRCAQNKVKNDFMRQRFHERPGLKRKRLASERWRKRFKENFRETIKLVQGLKKQGW